MTAVTKAARRPMNPVLARELKQRMRARHTWLVLTVYLALLALILRGVYVAASRSSSFDGLSGINLSSATVGRDVYQWLLFFMLLLVCFLVPGLTAAAISGERERQTLISLQLSLLRPRAILLGKLLASLAFVVLLIVASLPLLTIPFLVGGVSVSEVLQGLVMVLATAIVLACLGMACSTLVRRTQAATVLAYGVTAALVLGTVVAYGAQQIAHTTGQLRPRPWILALNPLAATADVVQGRNSAQGLGSPFAPIESLLRLDDNQRVTDVLATGGGRGIPVTGPNGQVVFLPAPVPTVAIGPVNGAGGVVGGAVIVPAGPGAVGGNFGGQARPAHAELGGIPFWVVSLVAWTVLGVAALVLAERRIRLPAAREQR